MYESTWESSQKNSSVPVTAISIGVSLIAHSAGLALLSSTLIRVPKIQEQNFTQHYAVRQLQLHSPEPRPHAPQQEASNQPSPQAPAAHSPDATALAQGGGHDKQTLLQPGFRTHALQLQAALPSVMIWTPELASKPDIVAPQPDAATTVRSQPSLEAPNQELNAVSDPISSGRLTPLIDVPPTGTTSPVASQADSLLKMAPATMSHSTEQPTPTTVLSVSDLQMHEGTVVLPPINQLHGAGIEPKPGSEEAANPQMTATPSAHAATPTNDEDRTALAQRLNATRVQLPKDGRFGFVAVGNSEGEDYPEAFEMWNGRVAYTAYLHVGLPKSWILQYAQTRAADADSAGIVARLEAPWPYDILRPNLSARESTADALILHGLINESGRFESLAIAFPMQFPAAQTIIDALKAWQFRPARQQGKPVSVEVLLIIPEQAG